jgi:hypothetical protein
LNLGLEARATFDVVLFSFSINVPASLTVNGTATLAPQGAGYQLAFQPQSISNFKVTGTFLDQLIQDVANGFILQLPPITMGSYTSLLPGVIAQYFTSSTPTLTITNSAAILSLTMSSLTTSGTLPSSQTWYGAVNLTGPVTVPAGVTLTLLPGTTINSANGSTLTVNGTLSAAGTSANPICFNFISPNSSTQTV